MKKYTSVLFIFLAFLIFQCSPKVVQQTTDFEDYSEDLSGIKPPLDSFSVEVVDEVEKAPYTPPAFDQTKQMNALIDSLAKDNLKRRFTFYTVQVYVGNSREEANEVRSKVYKIIPDETPRLEWSQPNFRVKVGKYQSRLDAHKAFTLLKSSFPGAILVSEKSYLSN